MGAVLALGSWASWPLALLNANLVGRFGGDRLDACAGAVAAALAGAAVALAARMGWGGLMGLVIPLFVFVFTTGFIVANAMNRCPGHLPAVCRSVSALVGATQYGTGILGSALVSARWPTARPYPWGW